MNLKYTYVGEETPEERLRNKLQPLFFLTELAAAAEDIRKYPELIKAAVDSLDDIRDHISDIRPFYIGESPIEFKSANTTKDE